MEKKAKSINETKQRVANRMRIRIEGMEKAYAARGRSLPPRYKLRAKNELKKKYPRWFN